MKALEPLAIPLSGTSLVEASAGTGKTFTIALLYLRLVMEKGLGSDQILVVTYTKAAAAELRERIRARLQDTAQALEAKLRTGEQLDRGPDSKVHEMVEACIARGNPGGELERLHRALRGFDEAAISTIHGFCQRMLDENAFESGVSFGTDLVADQRALVDDVVADYWTGNLFDADPEFVAWLRAAAEGGESIGPRLLASLADMVARYPRIVVWPERAPEVGADFDERRALLEQVSATWAQEGEEILDMLLGAAEAGVLSKQQFKPLAIQSSYAAEVERQLGRPVVGTTVPQMRTTKSGPRPEKRGLSRLTSSAVEAATRKGQEKPEHPFFDVAEALIEADTACLAAFRSRWLALELDLIDYTRRELARRRRVTRTRSFDELLTALADALDGDGGPGLAEGIRTRFPAALIDEFQDTDPVQYAIFRNVWGDVGAGDGSGAFFLIGDPKQAIYGFRGADVFAYMQAKHDAEADAVSLARNWRSDPAVVAGVNALFGRVKTPFLYEEIPFLPAQPAPKAQDRLEAGDGNAGLRVLYMPRGEGNTAPSKGRAKRLVSAAVADDIAVLLASGATIEAKPLTASDVAVLCRTNDQARAVQEQLRRRGVPSVMQTQQSVFETDEAAALERVLAAAAEPGNVAAIRAAITTPWVGVDAAGLAALDADPAGLDLWLEQVDGWNACLREDGALALVEHVLHSQGTRERMIAEAEGERRLTNLLHLAELMQSNAKSGPTSPRAQLRWLARMRRDAVARSEQAGDDAIVRLESDALAVQLVTIHRSKGLQYGVVYCPFLWDGRLLSKHDESWARFHDPDAQHRLTLDLGSERHDASVAWSRYEAFAESLRLLYVALTRARHRVVVTWGAVGGGENAALGLLLHPPPDFDALVGNRDPALVEACKTHFKDLRDEAMLADLDALASAADGAISIESLGASAAPTPAPPGKPQRVHDARSTSRRITQRRHVLSFSRLVQSEGGPGGQGGRGSIVDDHPAAAGRDYDAAPETAEPMRGAEDVDAQPVTLHAFPAGAGPGTLIHKVLERLDFASVGRDGIASLCEEELLLAGMPKGLAPGLAAGLREALDTPLGGPLGDFSLAGLQRSSRVDEMEFALPVALGGAPPFAARWALTPARLADAFARHAVAPAVQSYAERVASLGFRGLTGHLRGFIDLIFRRDGRYYLVDYKSNRLGPLASDYVPARLVDEMQRHDYVLQYHLYSVALHRFLAARLSDYSPEQHLGGAYYLFVRGMSPTTGPSTGIYHDRPPDALIAALSESIAAEPQPAAGEGAE